MIINVEKKLVEYIEALEQENKQLKEEKRKVIECIKDIRQSTFTKYNSNEWNNCLSFNDDIKPLLEILGSEKE